MSMEIESFGDFELGILQRVFYEARFPGRFGNREVAGSPKVIEWHSEIIAEQLRRRASSAQGPVSNLHSNWLVWGASPDRRESLFARLEMDPVLRQWFADNGPEAIHSFLKPFVVEAAEIAEIIAFCDLGRERSEDK